MHRFPGSLVFLAANIAICLSHLAFAGAASALQSNPESSVSAWTSSKAQHVYGLPDTKPNEKGTLALNANGLTFTGTSTNAVIQRHSIVAVGAGNERVELWGTTGRIVRMMIPNGGGLFAAGVMHHRVDMLTVEFRDSRGGYHGAVFLLPAHEAQEALQVFSQWPVVKHDPPNAVCERHPVQPNSVLVRVSIQDGVVVPPAYRALVYEHLIDRLRHQDGMGRVYRYGETGGDQGCPQYTVHVAIDGFKQGSQVMRAATGPVGMFAAPTQLAMSTTFTDASGKLNTHEDLKSTIRTESESRKVADGAAKNIAKHFKSALKDFEKSSQSTSNGGPR